MLFVASTDIKINTGKLLQGIVKSIDRTRKVVYMSSDPDTVSKHVVCLWIFSWRCVLFIVLGFFLEFNLNLILILCFLSCVQTKDVKGISFDLLIPGMMVDARVQTTLENGVMLSFLTYFTGTVSLYCF